MKIKLDHIIPFVLVIGLVALFYFNNKTPVTTNNGNIIIKPEYHTEVFRPVDQSGSIENDNKYIFKHKQSNDVLELLEKDGYLILPDGENKLPTRKLENGKEEDIWEVTHKKRSIIFDTHGWDFGTYAGFLDGNKTGTTIKDYDFGLRYSPLKIYDTFALDFLISNQDAGIGVSFYPAPIRYGDIWHHLGVGIAKTIDFENKDYHNMVYLSFSTRF